MATSISDTPASIGVLTQPTAGKIILDASNVHYPHFNLTFTLTGARVPITDAAASGSFGAIKLFDFVEGSVRFTGSRMNFSAFAEGTALTTAAGDAAFSIALGSAAIAAAADNSLTGTSVNVAPSLAVTLSGGTGTGTNTTALSLALDGTATAVDLYLNISGSAATIDATSYLDVTGTLTVSGQFIGDD